MTQMDLITGFQIRFYLFEDGIFVTAAAAEYKDLIGKQVLRIGNFSAAEAAKMGASVKGADNEFGQKEGIQYLVNAVVIHALGITNDKNYLQISYKNNDGSIKQISLRSVQTEEYTSNNWMNHGEMYAPTGTETITAFKELPAREYRLGRTDLPLHLRERLPYWYVLLEDKKTFYMQFNFVEDYENTTFAGFFQKMFTEMDKIKPEKFILDIRYNSGGDGSLLLPFVHEIIKRDYLDQSGKLFTIIGRKTFSAGVILASLMNEHTKSIFVGEPMGAAFNHYGDAGEIRLPNSKLVLQISRLFHQLSSSDDKSRYVSVDIPAVFDSKTYFAGRDVALDAISSLSKLESIPSLFLANNDSRSAMAEYSRRKNIYKNVPWWRPFSEFEMNKAGYELLAGKRIGDSITAFELNAKYYPQSWNAWDSLAEAYMTAGKYQKAIEFYKKSIDRNPMNSTATEMIAKMSKGKLKGN